MKIMVTVLSNAENLYKGQFLVGDNFYYASDHLAGTVVTLRPDDNWIEGEFAWVTRSEIPFISAIRLSQVEDNLDKMIPGRNPNPYITKYGPRKHGIFALSHYKEYKKFPSEAECIELIKKESKDYKLTYKFIDKSINRTNVQQIYNSFNYYDDLIIRAGVCLHKAYTLQSVSYMFSEEIYTNLYIAFEAIIEYLKLLNDTDKDQILEAINKIPGTGHFLRYEEEMRDQIRNNIIHPWRENYEISVVQPMQSIEYIFEDLPFVDWLFKQVILNKLDLYEYYQ
jgi:hypothetical protein